MAEKRVIELEVTTNEKSLKAQLREAQAEVQKLAEKFGATSDEAVRAAKKAAELKDAIGDAKALTDAYNPDAKFNALSQSITGVLNGFQAFEGALGLVGVESENVQKALLRVQSAMALTQGINGVLESKESFKNLEKQVSSLASSATSAFKNMTAGSKALALTGIGLLITAIGLVIANWESVSKAIGLSNDEQKKYAAQQKAINEEAKKQREEVAKQSSGFALLISQLKATNANSKERVDLINKINSQYGTTLKNLKDEKKFQEQVNAELANYLEYQKAKYRLQKNEDLIVKNLSKQDELEAKITQAKKDQTKAIEDGALKRKTLYETDDMGRRISLGQGYANEQAAIAYEKATKAISVYESELKKAQKRFEYYGEAANDAQAKVGELTNQGTKYVEKSNSNAATETKTITEIADLRQQIYEEQIKQIQDLNAQQQTKLIVDAETRIKEVESSTATEEQKAQLITLIRANLNTELEKLDADYYAKEEEAKIEANRLKIEAENEYLNEIESLQEINYQNTLTEYQREIQAVNDKYFKLEEAAKGNAEQLAIIEEAKQNELAKIEIQNALAVQQHKAAIQQQGLDTALQGVQLIASLFEKQKKVQQAAIIAESAIGIAKMIISNKLANAGALATPQAILTNGVSAAPVIAMNNISTGIGIAANIAATAKALKQLGGGAAPTAPNVSGGGGSGAMAPNFNVIGSSGVNQLAQIQQQPTRAYVVSGDVANGLSLERNRLQNASF
jgi:hypothetical protein